MLTQNQQEIIDSITQEFLTFNEQRKVVSKSFNFFDTSVLDSENEYAAEQIAEAKIINKSIHKQLMALAGSDFNLLKQDLPKVQVALSAYLDVEWGGLPPYEKDTKFARIRIGEYNKCIIIEYYAHGNRHTAANGETYVIWNGDYRVVNTCDTEGNISAPTLADLFANEKFTQRFTNFYRKLTNKLT